MSTNPSGASAANKTATGPEKKIQLRKKTAKELEEMATAKSHPLRVTSCESTDEEPRPPVACPSETSMQKLNSDLKKVPMVKAFNTAEKQLEKPK